MLQGKIVKSATPTKRIALRSCFCLFIKKEYLITRMTIMVANADLHSIPNPIMIPFETLLNTLGLFSNFIKLKQQERLEKSCFKKFFPWTNYVRLKPLLPSFSPLNFIFKCFTESSVRCFLFFPTDFNFLQPLCT